MKRILKQSALGAALTFAGLLGASGNALADSVAATFTGLTPSISSSTSIQYSVDMSATTGLTKSGTTYAGIFNFDNASGPIDFFNADEFVSFCIDLEDTVKTSNTYEVVSLDAAPDAAAGPMGAAKATDLAKLLGGAIGSGKLNDARFLSDNEKMALQIAVWEVVHETDASYDFQAGKTTFSGANITTDIENLIDGYLTGIKGATAMQGLVGLIGADNKQDFIGQVPLPAAAWLFISAVVGVTALGRRKRKEQAMVAA